MFNIKIKDAGCWKLDNEVDGYCGDMQRLLERKRGNQYYYAFHVLNTQFFFVSIWKWTKAFFCKRLLAEVEVERERERDTTIKANFHFVQQLHC